MSLKVHLRPEHPTWRRTPCGQILDEDRITDDLEAVTCGSCQYIIEQDHLTTEEVAEDRARRRALAIARGRAMGTLRDRYWDEYVRLTTGAFTEVYPDIYATELRLQQRLRDDG